jgi:RES domain
VIVFRHTDPRFPFMWETAGQPASRWNDDGGGPVNTFADTPEGAWAELLRHEEIVEPGDVLEVRRSLWAVEIGELPTARPRLPRNAMTGGVRSYPACRREAVRLKERGVYGFVAPSAALVAGGAHGWRVAGGLRRGPERDGRVIVLLGPRPDLLGWEAVHRGRPSDLLLRRVRHFGRARAR